MSQYIYILLLHMSVKLVALIILIRVSIGLFKGLDYTNNGEELKFKNKYSRIIFKRVFPIIMILFGLYIQYNPVLDLVKRDFLQNELVLASFSAPKNNIFFEELYFKDVSEAYFFPKSYLKNMKLEKGEKYKVTYANRTGVIVEMKKIER